MKKIFIWIFPWSMAWITLAESVVEILTLGLLHPQWTVRFCLFYFEKTT